MRRWTAVLVMAAVGALLPALTPTAFGAAVTATCADLQTKLNAANPGDVITITDAACTNRSYEMKTGVPVTLEGAPTTFTGHAPGADRILTAADVKTSVLRNMTFRNSVNDNIGGAVLMTGTSWPLLDNLVFTGNGADVGGGLFLESLTPGVPAGTVVTIRNSLFGGPATPDANTATVGGGAYVGTDVALLVQNNCVEGNQATVAAGLLVTNDLGPGVAQTVDHNVFKDNGTRGDAIVAGGLLAETDDVLELTGNTIQGNRVTTVAGGVLSFAGTAIISGNTFEGNKAGVVAGGLQHSSQSGPVTMTGNTFRANETGLVAGGALVGPGSGASEIGGNQFIDNVARCPSSSSFCEGVGVGLYV